MIRKIKDLIYKPFKTYTTWVDSLVCKIEDYLNKKEIQKEPDIYNENLKNLDVDFFKDFNNSINALKEVRCEESNIELYTNKLSKIIANSKKSVNLYITLYGSDLTDVKVKNFFLSSDKLYIDESNALNDFKNIACEYYATYNYLKESKKQTDQINYFKLYNVTCNLNETVCSLLTLQNNIED